MAVVTSETSGIEVRFRKGHPRLYVNGVMLPGVFEIKITHDAVEISITSRIVKFIQTDRENA